MCETPWYRLFIFLACLMKAAEIQAQCAKPSVGGNRVIVDDLGLTTYPNGSTLIFKCSIGYKTVNLTASKTITCVGPEWTNLDLTCTKKSCGSLPDLSNGKYTFPDGNLFGATAIAVCNEGYMMVGVNTRNCHDSGWDGRDPVCEVVKCLPPPTMQNGTFQPVKDFYNYNEVVTYTCTDGYTLDGNSEISCSNNGTFQPPPPRCVFVRCETPDIKNAVRIEGKSPPYGYGNFVKYKCNEGYTMIGADNLVCEINGWNPPPPTCIQQCTKPIVGGNREMVNDSGLQTYPNGSTITFKCSTGYQPVDPLASRTMTCIGPEWTNLDLTCTKKSCGSLPDLANGKYTFPDGILFGATAIAECNKGYSLVGVKTRNCLDAGWDGRDPVCEAVKCLPPQTVQNGTFEPVKDFYNYNEVVTYTCSNDYTLDGVDSLTCSDNGTFQPPPPRCTIVRCETPNIKNAVRIEGKAPPYGYGNFVRYKCDDGYTMTGDDYLVCEIHGWSPPPPSCTRSQVAPTTPPPSNSTQVAPTTPPPSDGTSVKSSIIIIAVVVSIVVLLGILLAVFFSRKKEIKEQAFRLMPK
ncbi:zona pellucida sperm-binding protein 3 receptor-like isoform X2 [Silurus meridionalis]|uniref:zona pellucida sperm-binding protein 3 receptor-like isoform X2 n=2 Tax=Silurus meridionalis TaxID=175797 RepID=UPI001EECC41E|nr:zona pellucida sperm-binding protein 3 receptor-like isoform X2 [Silurus meridionalis]